MGRGVAKLEWLVVAMVITAAVIFLSIKVAYELSHPRICLCPAAFSADLVVFNGNEPILNKSLIVGPPCLCAGFRGWSPPSGLPFIIGYQVINMQRCSTLTNITAPPGIINYTCYVLSGYGNSPSFLIPIRIFTSPSAINNAKELINEFLRYNGANLSEGFNGTVRLLMGIPTVRDYIDSGRLILVGEGFITNTTKVGNYLVINVMGIEYTMGVITQNRTVMGIIYVEYIPFRTQQGSIMMTPLKITIRLMRVSAAQIVGKSQG
ncbi:hypothetical protein [Vulcanisaeta sp. JCM 16159]|uniref:hypothetical protein n=1 Tax=Vulcanisaeta sp. JCM 16159 TaxID=1295371 RepID=UPI0006CF5408|nr:hypothetical protein [Vulcanisaeta sp. JCM 16159]